MKKITILLGCLIYLYGCTTVDEVPLTSDQLEFPSLMNVNKQPFESTSNVSGTIKDVSKDELGMLKIVISTETDYYYLDKVLDLKYYLLYGGMEEVYVEVGDEIKRGDKLGLASADSYLTSFSPVLDNYMLRMSEGSPAEYNGNWYYSPDWLIDGNTAWLTFRPVESFENALNGFYDRWVQVGNVAKGYEINYHNNLDRIRFKIRLSDYPQRSIRDSAIKLVEKTFYEEKQVFILESKYADVEINDYTVLIYWQKDFDSYLKDEYTLGEELYIYGSVYAFDHREKEIIVCVRDFSLSSDEAIILEFSS